MLRKLSDKERKICLKQIKRLEEEKEHDMWLRDYNKLMIERGLFMNYKIKLKEFKQIGEKIDCDISINKHKIDILKGQIEKGVEIKEKKEEASKSYVG